MLIVLGLYFGLVWLLFSKLKVLPWNGFFKTIVYGGALLIALVVIGALNHTTPSGTVSVQGAVINIAPNVSGPVTEVAVTANQAVAKGDVLFRIDNTTQAAEVARLKASLASAQSAADQLQTDHQLHISWTTRTSERPHWPWEMPRARLSSCHAKENKPDQREAFYARVHPCCYEDR